MTTLSKQLHTLKTIIVDISKTKKSFYQFITASLLLKLLFMLLF